MLLDTSIAAQLTDQLLWKSSELFHVLITGVENIGALIMHARKNKTYSQGLISQSLTDLRAHECDDERDKVIVFVGI